MAGAPSNAVTCSALSLEVSEPLAGTAVADTDLWVVLEQPAGWGPQGFEDSGLAPELVAQLRAFVARWPRARVQLMRRPERTGAGAQPGERLLFLARGEPDAPSLHRIRLAEPGALAAVDLDAWAAGSPPADAVPLDQPLYLVCVHGKRDRCCAQRGMPVFTALAEVEGERVWQTTHLGGHRFAATLLVLPAGICYGRVEPAEAAPLSAAHARGDIYDVARVRGRCAYPSAVQAAELALRAELRESGLRSLRFSASDPSEQGVRVRFQHLASGREHELEVRAEPLPPAPASCGAPAKAGQRLVALRRGHAT
jgi:hypothetical protein